MDNAKDEKPQLQHIIAKYTPIDAEDAKIRSWGQK